MSEQSILLFAIFSFIFFLWYLILLISYHYGEALLRLIRSLSRSIYRDEIVNKWFQEHDKINTFLQRRVDERSFSGLPLTLFSLIGLYVLLLLSGVTEDVLENDVIVAVDHYVADLMIQYRSIGLTRFFLAITAFGSKEVALFFLISVLAVLTLYRRPAYAVGLLVSVAIGTVSAYMGKITFERARPEHAIVLEQSFSFPSGHAMISVALYGFSAYLLIHATRDIRRKYRLLLIASIPIMLIAFSRIYLGVHFLSDIYSGLLLGTLCFVVGSGTLHFLEHRRPDPRPPYTFAKSISMVIALSFLLFYLWYVC